jgi:hypothetical protein
MTENPKQEQEKKFSPCLKIVIKAPNFKEGMSNITQFDF